MVLGPESAGKTTLVKFLANYALRSPAVCSLGKASEQKEREKETEEGDEKEKSKLTGWWPVVVNLDPSEVSRPVLLEMPCDEASPD